MSAVPFLQKQFVDYLVSLHTEQYLDDHFTQLQKLADEKNPYFASHVVTIFFQDSYKLIQDLAKAIEQPNVDFNQVDYHATQFKGSCSSIGAHRVKNQCVKFQMHIDKKNRDGCLACLQDLKHEYHVLKTKLTYLFQLEREIRRNGGTIPTLQ